MDKKAYYFSQKLGEQPYMAKKRSGVSYSTLVIILLSTVLVLVLLFSKRNSISDFFGGRGEGIEVENGEMLYVGDSIAISGTLSDDGDLINYTHKIYTSDYGFLGVRSRSLDLNEFSGEVFIEGKIEDIYDDLPIIEIEEILSSEPLVEDTGLLMPVGTYISRAGLYFPPEFFESYSLDNNGENGQIKLTNLSSNTAITIEYFTCTTSDSNKNCASLTTTFSQSPEQTFANAYGVTFYKLQDVSTWYFANSTRYGYFIHNVPQDEIRSLGLYIMLPNEYYINQYVKPNLPQICRQGDIVWESTTSTSISLKDSNLLLEAKGIYEENALTCKITLDPSTPFGGTLMQLDQAEGTTPEEDSSTTSSSSVDLDPSVMQFPIRQDKTLQFASRRGHTIIMPSTNLSFKEVNEDADFDQAGVHCFASLNIIKYEKDETLKDQLIVDSPSVRVHECTMKKGFSAASNMIHKTIGDKNFVIEILDSAWVNFANNIQITVQ